MEKYDNFFRPTVSFKALQKAEQKLKIIEIKAKIYRTHKHYTKLDLQRNKVMEMRIEYIIGVGDEHWMNERHFKACIAYQKASDLAKNSKNQLLAIVKKRQQALSESVRATLHEQLLTTLSALRDCFLANNLVKIDEITEQFRGYLKHYQWVGINGVFADFTRVLVLYWKELFPELIVLADTYYDQKKYAEARSLFNRCKDVVRMFKYGEDRTRLIQSLLHYENLCNTHLTYAKIFKLLNSAKSALMRNQLEKAISLLNRVREVEATIPIQFKIKKYTRIIFSTINALYEKITRIPRN